MIIKPHQLSIIRFIISLKRWQVFPVRSGEAFEGFLGDLAYDSRDNILELFWWVDIVNALSYSSFELLLQESPATLDAVELATVRWHPHQLEVFFHFPHHLTTAVSRMIVNNKEWFDIGRSYFLLHLSNELEELAFVGGFPQLEYRFA